MYNCNISRTHLQTTINNLERMSPLYGKGTSKLLRDKSFHPVPCTASALPEMKQLQGCLRTLLQVC